MADRYAKWVVGVLVTSVVGLVIGLILHAKYAADTQSCSTLLHRAEQAISANYRATCTTASAMAGIGTAIMVVCGCAAVLAVIVGIVRYMQTHQNMSA
jgi:hypothetical protein